MRWLWFIGPLMVLGSYLSVVLGGTTEDVRRKLYLNRWVDEFLGALLDRDKTKLSRRVRALPEALLALVEDAGAGARVADIVLVPQQAYLAVRAASGETLSAQHTVVCRLKKAAPSLVVRPLPIVDGRPLDNRGLVIDDAFGEAFIVDGDNAKTAKKWLDDEVRAALLELPEVWLRTRGDTLALTLYGALDADRIDELVATADALFARHGSSHASLLGDGTRLGSNTESPESRVRETRRAASALDVAEGEIAAPALRLKAALVDALLYGVAAFFVALTNGCFNSFHPLALFNNPDVVVTEPWQGGFTTKGIGAFTAALGLLVGLFAYQTYQAATHGRSIGKSLVGLRIVRTDDRPVDFLHAVLLRQWLSGAAVIAVAAFLTKPFSSGAMFARLLTTGPLALGAGLVALGITTLARDRDQRGFHDKFADTKVVEASVAAVPGIQLAATKGMDPIAFGQAMSVVGLALLLLVALGVVYGFDITVSQVPQEALALVVFLPVSIVQIARRAAKQKPKP